MPDVQDPKFPSAALRRTLLLTSFVGAGFSLILQIAPIAFGSVFPIEVYALCFGLSGVVALVASSSYKSLGWSRNIVLGVPWRAGVRTIEIQCLLLTAAGLLVSPNARTGIYAPKFWNPLALKISVSAYQLLNSERLASSSLMLFVWATVTCLTAGSLRRQARPRKDLEKPLPAMTAWLLLLTPVVLIPFAGLVSRVVSPAAAEIITIASVCSVPLSLGAACIVMLVKTR